MTYSTAERRGNAAEIADESESLIRFLYNKARSYFYDRLAGVIDDPEAFGGIIYLCGIPFTPLVFAYYVLTGPFIYKDKDNSRANKKSLEERI